VAAIFGEPIQGEGGYIVPPPEFLPALRALCDQHGILLVLDEIQTGMGRTGKMFAFEHTGIIPDIVCVAKGIASGMPIGAVVAPESIMNWPPGAQGSTFGGNPVACAAALATIELIETELMKNAERLGGRLSEHLFRIADKHRCLEQPRGVGLMCAVDIVGAQAKPNPQLRERLLNEAFARGLVLLGCGEIAIRFCPALSIAPQQLDAAMKIFDETVSAIATT
jgi:4-aminobutyrate aminotransferase